MAETVETPAKPEDENMEVVYDDKPLLVIESDAEPEAEEKEEVTEETKEVEAKEEPVKEDPIDSIKQLISAMSQEIASLKEQKKAPPEEKEEDLLAGIDETVILPELLAPLKKLAEANKNLKAEMKTLKATRQEESAQSTHQRVCSVIDTIVPELSKKFDNSQEGQQRQSELYSLLGSMYENEKRSGKMLDESVRVRRALAALDMIPEVKKEDKKKQEDFDKHKAKYNGGALAEPTNRKPALSVYDAVNKILEADRRRSKPKDEYVVKFED